MIKYNRQSLSSQTLQQVMGQTPYAENLAAIIQENDVNDFKRPHGTIYAFGKYYVGCRLSSTFVCYYDLNNLKKRTKITLPGFAGGQGIESICADYDNNRIYAPVSNSRNLISFNPDNVTQYTIHAISGMGALKFSGSCPIVTDGDNIFICSETAVNPSLFKIKISDMSLVSITAMPFGNGGGAHSGTISPDKTQAYFFNNGQNGAMAKVNLSDLSYTEVATGLNSNTDDCVYVPAFPLSYNAVVAVSEFGNFDNKNAVIINVDDMVVGQYLDIMPAFGVTYNTVTNVLYFANRFAGSIETLDLNKLDGSPTKNLTDVYPTRGIVPNEVIVTQDTASRVYITDWEESNTPKKSFFEVQLTKVPNTLLSKQEYNQRYAYPQTNIYRVYQDFTGFYQVEEIMNQIGINFTFEYHDVGMINCPQFDDTMTIYSRQIDVKNGVVGSIYADTSTAGANLYTRADGAGLTDDIGQYGMYLFITKLR